METIFGWTESPSPCEYSPEFACGCEYLYVGELGADEYLAQLKAGWRRFGRTLFRLLCTQCGACRPLRIDVARFQPNRSQRRCCARNHGNVRLDFGIPSVTAEKVALLDRFHADRTATRGWPPHDAGDAEGYFMAFVDNPFPTQEWRYFVGKELVGVGYVDELASGLSAIFFMHEPTHRERSLGTWNVLSLIDRAAALGLPYLYLGNYTPHCASLAYKAHFEPCETLERDGTWRAHVRGK
jgi:arginine-tRNA-protein transferase